ncbi:sigma-54-dependent Fis family transcriptional regulator [Alkalihalophilus pseudofirmus]|uniref:sigma-54-dependent transcriptional regulator n=1 Tax=Alkalihalophilus pseudofirmus TaxID=79885 RepID=UPI0009533573|nr:sigma-54 dependent transcriptional regulator [Alkalihalophilus pseudofirmus]OLS39571.1 sigma-54-dependent Fis family transcriptional regulator [Alkalihalophilus pseudofirmus]WEG16030.1 sigma-54 dependent transcriptional regulator [Alkalihalophilus pseudofirmus]
MKKIVIIDDEASICSSLTFALEDDYHVEAMTDPEEGKKRIDSILPDLVLLDLKIGAVDGLKVLEEIKGMHPSIVVIMITAYGTISSSVEALQKGAYSYLTKPINMDELQTVIKQALHFKYLHEQVEQLSNELEKKYRYEELIGQSDGMQQVFKLIDKVRNVDSNVLITGESGTGKELVARAIHYSGKRKQQHLETVNCAAIPEHLLESELFGYEKGAFTGAVSSKDGKFQLANGGTIFLDEIGDMPLALQAKLLRVLQRREVTKLGSNSTQSLDVRVIAATNKDLEEAVREGEFREDLYFRLHVIPIHLPPLRERKEDLQLLISHLIKSFNKEMNTEVSGISKEAYQILSSYSYPGNIRELANILESSMVFASGSTIEVEDLPLHLRSAKPQVKSGDGDLSVFVGLTLKELERQFILETLEYNDGHRKKTAEMLQISERSLRDKLKQYASTTT